MAGPAAAVDPAAAKKRRLVIIGACVALLLAMGGAGAGFLLWRRAGDPLRRAEVLEQAGAFRAAQVELRSAQRLAPRDADIQLRLARLQMKLADPVAAERSFKLARNLGADRWVVTPELADALLAQGLNEETLRTVPQAAPTAEIAARTLFRRSIAQLGLGDVKAATATLAAAQKVAPDAVETQLIAARLAAAREDYAETERRIDMVLQRDPKQIDALLTKQQIVATRNDHPAALSFAARAVESAPWSAQARIRHATELMVVNQDDQAQADVNAILAVQPRFIEAIYLNGILLARRARYQEAAIELEKLDPAAAKFPQALYYQGLVAANLGQVETAVAYARRYNALVPADLSGVRLVARADITAGASEHAIPILKAAIAGGLNDAEIYDLLGSAQANLGNTPDAIQSFQQALRLAPNDAGVLTHLGLAQIQSGSTGEATLTLSRTMELPAASQSAGEALVSAAIAEGDLPRAEAALARLRSKAGDSQQVGILGGMIELRRRNLDAARTAFADTLRRFPGSLSAKLDYARVLVEQGRRLDGMALMAEVLAKEPGSIPALNAYVPLLVQNRQLDRVIAVLDAAHIASPRQAGFTATLADALVLSGDAARAVATLQGVREAGALPPLLLAALARAQAAAGLVDDAKANFRDVLRQVPDDIVDRTAFIDLLLRNKEFDVARIELQAALARSPGSFRFMSTSVELEAQTKGLDAGLALADALRAEPSHRPYATLLKGDALMRARRYNAAIRAFLDEYAASPAVPPLQRAAAAYVAAGQEAEASRLLEAWLSAKPNTPGVLQDLAKLDLRANRLPQAQAHLEALLAMLPNDATALNNLAYTYQLRRDPRARAVAQKAYLQDGSAASADTFGWIMAQGGETEQAIPVLQQAAAQAPRDAGTQYHLAAALGAAGRGAEARAILAVILARPDVFAERAAAETLMKALPGG